MIIISYSILRQSRTVSHINVLRLQLTNLVDYHRAILRQTLSANHFAFQRWTTFHLDRLRLFVSLDLFDARNLLQSFIFSLVVSRNHRWILGSLWAEIHIIRVVVGVIMCGSLIGCLIIRVDVGVRSFPS